MDISSERLSYLIRISTLDFKNPIAIQDLIKKIKISRANFTFIKRLLKEQQIITEQHSYGNAVLLTINIRKLDSFIKETSLYRLIANYVIMKDPLLHQI